ncbi:MAG: hypothetical protein LBK08_07430 [Treponema sp.]|nr:hypothetical protein [Treponema sp.]
MRMFLFAFPPVLFALVFSACTDPVIPSVDRVDLFSRDIGRMEDQIALYSLEGDRGRRRTDFTMRDGLFYISDSSGEKIVRYTSFGDLLFMIYNDETNPPPLSLKPQAEDSSLVTRWAFPYPLREPGEIVVDSRRHIYAGDLLPPERHSVDGENRALLDSVILHFDSDGRFVEYLGQEGIGGSPFPRITGLYVSARDELAVICRLPAGWNVYWFDSAGTLLYLVQLKNSAIPVPSGWSGLVPSVDAIAAAPDERKLYLKVDYYRDTFDESTNTRTGNEPGISIVWIMNVENGIYSGRVEVPLAEYTYTENGRRVTSERLYSMLGVIRGGHIFLFYPAEEGYSLLILDADSDTTGNQHRGVIRVSNDELRFNVFDLSAEGILSAMLAGDYEVKLVWWRTDRLLGALP